MGKRPGFDLWIRKTPWRRAWQPTPVFQPGESHGQRSWRAAVHGATKSQTPLRDKAQHSTATCDEKNESERLSTG